MSQTTFTITGHVLHAHNHEHGISGLKVEAWDRDLLFDDLVGTSRTDALGKFTFEFTAAHFQECFLDRRPDLFFKVFRHDGALLLDTRDTVLWNTATGSSELAEPLLVDPNQPVAPVEAPPSPEEPDPPAPEPPAATVTGYVRTEAGEPMTEVTVKAYRRGLRSETYLGEVTPDEQGHYILSYALAANSEPPDLMVRVFDDADTLLHESPLRLAASPHESVNFGGEPLPPSEYETLVTSLNPHLEGATLTDLTPAELAYLTEKTSLNRQHLVALSLSAKLADQTELPTELFYGLLRQQLPTSLLPLLDLPPATWRTALENALEQNWIPATLQADLDSHLDRLQQLADEAQRPDEPDTPSPRPRIRLNPTRLHHSLLENLKANEESHDYLNTTLNSTLRQVLGETLDTQGHTALATFIKTLPDLDLGEQADTALRDFVTAQVEDARAAGNTLGIDTLLADSIQALSTKTTVGQLLGLDAPLDTHPLFDVAAQLTRFRSLLDTSPQTADRDLQTAFIDKYQAHTGDLSEFWQSLQDDDTFADKVDDLKFTLQLGWLTEKNIPLVQTLRTAQGLANFPTLHTPRDLAQLDLDQWKTAIQATAPDGDPEIPETIPGDAIEDRVNTYAQRLITTVERAFPTDFVAKRLRVAPSLRLQPLRQALAKYPDLELRDELPGDLEISDEARQALDMLRQEVILFPEFDYDQALNALNGARTVNLKHLNPTRCYVAQFFADNPDFDLRHHRVDRYLDDHSSNLDDHQDALRNIPIQEQGKVRLQLKRMKRIFSIAPRSDQMYTLLNHGFSGAVSIAAVPYKNFVTLAPELGGVSTATAIHRAASDKAIAVTQFGTAISLNILGVAPKAAGGTHIAEQVRDLVLKEMPEWQTLFGSLDLCQCEHCRSVYGPAAYFVDLLQLINHKPLEGEKPLTVLKERRPDLTHIKLTCENASTPLPYIDLVNEILEYYVVNQKLTKNAAKNTEGITAEALRVNPQHTETDAYTRLKDAVYPFSAPFDRDIEIARVYLNHLGSSRDELMGCFFDLPTNETANTNDSDALPSETAIACESLGLSWSEADVSSQGRIIVGALERDLYKFYGYGSKSDKGFIKLVEGDIPEILGRTGLKYLDLLELLKTRFINPGFLWIGIESNSDDCDLSKMRLVNRLETDSGSKLPLEKIHRFIRLWQQVEESILDLDRCIVALQASPAESNPSASRDSDYEASPLPTHSKGGPALLNETFLQDYAQAKQLQATLNCSLLELLALWADIDTHGENSLYHQLFLNQAALAVDSAFEGKGNPKLAGTILFEFSKTYLNNSGEKIVTHIPTLLAAFRVSGQDFALIRADAALAGDDVDLSLANVSQLYRYTVLAKALRLSIPDFISLKTLVNYDPFATPAATIQFVDLVRKLQASDFSVAQLNYLYRHLIAQPATFAPAWQTTLTLVKTLRDGLLQIAEETAASDAPTREDVQTALGQVLEANLVEQLVGLLDGTAIYETPLDEIRDTEIPYDKLERMRIKFPEDGSTEFGDRLTYSPAHRTLVVKGALTEAEADFLKAEASAIEWQLLQLPRLETPVESSETSARKWGCFLRSRSR
jgi:hypothetical protein